MLFGLPTEIVLAILSGTGLILFLFLLAKLLRPETRVLLLSDDDSRLDEITVDNETSRSLKQKGKRKWFKWGKAFLQVKNGKRITTYLGKRGTAYTWKADDGEVKKWGTFWEALNVLWPQDLIKKIPQSEADKLKTSEVFVTVNIAKGITPEGFQPMTEDDLLDEADIEAAQDYAEGAKGARKTVLLPLIMAAGTGGLLVMLALGFLGWLRVGGQVAPAQPAALFAALVNLL
jgi:hypothetical protein